jgi:hypothetical protein
MVVKFKLAVGAETVFNISKDVVESVTGKRAPWFQNEERRDDDCLYAVCPFCENPIQLKALYRRTADSPKPYGSHTGQAENGFPHFDEVDLQFCPHRLKRRTHKKTSRRPMGAAPLRLIQISVAEFDRIILLLRKDFEMEFSNAYAGRMLEQWFDSRGYLYTGAHLRNLPWMIAYFAPVESIFGQRLGEESRLRHAIQQSIPAARFSEIGKLSFKDVFCRLELQCLHHRIKNDVEEMTIRVQDFTKTNRAPDAPTIFTKVLNFRPREI